MSDLRFIKKVDISSASSVANVQDVFSSDYTFYKVIWDDIALVGSAGWIDIRLINENGNALRNSNYCGAHMDMNSSGIGTFQSANQSYFDRGLIYNNGTQGACQEMTVFNPYEDDRYTFISAASRNGAGSGDSGDYKLLVFKNITRVTGIQAVQRNGYTWTGSVKVYGMRYE